MSGEPGRGLDLRRVLLLGFMGSGKSSVGRALARELDWRFIDFDDVVVREEGRSVPEIFRAMGEAHFRRVEERVGDLLLREEQVVLASGGGWAAAPGRVDAVPPGTETVWLKVSHQEAVRRVAAESGERPLLAATDPGGTAARLLAERERYYARAGSVVDTDGRSVEDVTGEVLAILARKHPAVLRTEAE